jgi:hypothetical protein
MLKYIDRNGIIEDKGVSVEDGRRAFYSLSY